MKYHNFIAMVAEVLQYYGGYHEATPYVHSYIFYDKKVILYGIKDDAGEKIISLGVWLQCKPPYKDLRIPRFTQPKMVRDATPVCLFDQQQSIYFRPGRWITYLHGLHKQRENEMGLLSETNGKQFDDYKLFSDIASADIPIVTFD